MATDDDKEMRQSGDFWAHNSIPFTLRQVPEGMVDPMSRALNAAMARMACCKPFIILSTEANFISS